MADIQKLSYPYFTDNTTALNATNLNPIIAKLNEVIDKVNGGVTPTQTVATPTISISGTTATISCATAGATIYYTTNGNTPTTSSTQYTSAITLSSACTIKAIAVKSGMNNSSVASQSYTPSVVATPVISISGNSATITCATSGAQIRYTLDGTTPTANSTLYSSAIALSQSCTIKAIAIKSGMTNSSVASKSYTPSSQRSQEAQAVINKFNNMSSANQDKVATFVDSLVSAGIYSKLNYLMIPTVAGSVAEGVQNVLSSVTPPSVSNATISDGLKMTGEGVIDLNSMINGTFDYQNYTIAIKVENATSPSGSVNRVLTLGTAPTTGLPSGTASRFGIINSSSTLAYDGYAAQKAFYRFGIVRHNNTALSEAYYTDDALTTAEDSKTISDNNGLFLSSNKTAAESDLRGNFQGTYKIIVIAGVLSDTEMSALATAIDTFLS